MGETFVPVPVPGEILDFDPFGHAFRENPTAFHEQLFANSPAFIMMEGVPSAYIARFDQVTAVLRDWKNFSSLKPKGLPGMQRIDFFNGLPVMNYSDPPDHTRRRKVVNPAFTPKRVELLLDAAAKKADELIDACLAKGRFDFMTDLCKPLSAYVLLDRFMEIADEHKHIFMNYVTTLPLLDALKIDDPKPQAYLDAWEEGKAFCREQQELARRGECTNLVGVIAQNAEGGAIDEDEMMAMMVVLLIGGVSTVAGAAGVCLKNLVNHPEAAERIRQDGDLAKACLEESLRLDPPVSLLMRFANADMEIGGQMIPKGVPVYAMIAAACHDPAVFPDPYMFDIDRPNAKDHIAFGYGMHTCIGNAITRSLVPMLLRKVVERMPDLRLASEDAIQWETGTPRARHLRTLDVEVGKR